MKGRIENKDANLAEKLLIAFIILVVITLVFSKQILGLFQNPSLYAPTSFFGLARFQIYNLIFGFSFFSIFSVLGYKKARQKRLNPVRWAFICFFFNFWGYIYLLYRKNKN
jgi:hypothetical protein